MEEQLNLPPETGKEVYSVGGLLRQTCAWETTAGRPSMTRCWRQRTGRPPPLLNYVNRTFEAIAETNGFTLRVTADGQTNAYSGAGVWYGGSAGGALPLCPQFPLYEIRLFV